MKRKQVLSGISTQGQVARLLSVPSGKLDFVLKKGDRMYQELTIAKKDGTPRTITAPAKLLKEIQRAVLYKILGQIPLGPAVYGFGPGRTIVENAQLHARSEYLLNADIKNFFPSVHHTRVQRIFAEMGAQGDALSALTRLTTYRFSLPQGAPTSPYLANLVLVNLDKRITELCRSNGLVYSRYFDDITISGGGRAHDVLETLKEIVDSVGYRLHDGPDKLRLAGPGEDWLVTGIIIRKGILVPPKVAEIRDYIIALQRKGMAGLLGDNPLKEQQSLRGSINFIRQVQPLIGQQLEDELKKVPW